MHLLQYGRNNKISNSTTSVYGESSHSIPSEKNTGDSDDCFLCQIKFDECIDSGEWIKCINCQQWICGWCNLSSNGPFYSCFICNDNKN